MRDRPAKVPMTVVRQCSDHSSRKIRQNRLRAHPAAPDAAEENGHNHDSEKEEEEDKKEKICLTDPDDRTKKI